MAKADDTVEAANYADFTGLLRENEWCCQTGLNCRPLHYQWSALPLSYGSMPGSGESAQKASTGGRFLPQGPRWRKHAAGPEGCKKREKITPWRRLPASTAATPGRSGSLLPSPRAASTFSGRTTTSNSIILRDSSKFDEIDTPQLASCRSWRKTPAWRHEAEPAVQHPLRQCMWFARRCILPVLNVYSNGPAMKDDKANRDRPISSPAKDSRQDRLKLALRENLKRRKSQARGRSDAVGASSEDADASLDDGSGKAPGR